MYTYFRPELKSFLIDLSKYFEIVLFSNGSTLYTDAVVAKLQEKLNKNEDI
jgi:TFIIF-interacting CTD phosphatase-like protein